MIENFPARLTRPMCLIKGYYVKVARSRAIWSAGPNSVPRRTRMIVSKLFYRLESVHAEEQARDQRGQEEGV